MFRPHSFLIVTLAFLSVIGPVGAAETKPSWQREWEKILEGAKKEGEVRLWGEQEITHPDIIAAFNKEYPFIKAVTVSGRVGDLMPRIIAERRAGKFLADIYSGGLGGRSFFDFHKAGVLDPLKPVLLLPEVVDGSKWLNGEHSYADSEKQFVFMYEGSVAGNGLHYNTGLVDLKAFKSYWDLLSPNWKGKILVFERPGVGSPSVIRYYHHAQLGPDFVKRLFSEMDVTVSQDRRQSGDWLAAGKFPICIDCGDTDRAKQQGLPVDEFPHANLKEASYEVSTSGNSGIALINNAPNSNAAKVFINWFLSRAGQTVWQTVMNTKVQEPSDSMRIDIPKDKVAAPAKREEGRRYRVTGFLDPDPPTKLFKELISKEKRK
ncbi:MAG TPA: extracellular solute-binding protein [Candidatus Binatia bacterium]|jgi:ABC-type Fe3+ transport system substrate-binding protein|nr:extracellular solute-binding protein [Candidatus Binatia bacterium]